MFKHDPSGYRTFAYQTVMSNWVFEAESLIKADLRVKVIVEVEVIMRKGAKLPKAIIIRFTCSVIA